MDMHETNVVKENVELVYVFLVILGKKLIYHNILLLLNLNTYKTEYKKQTIINL